MADQNHWSIELSRQLYNMGHWDDGYFTVNEKGHLAATPHLGDAVEIDMIEVVRHIRQADLGLPVLVRFVDILRDRVETLCGAFAQAMQQHDYRGDYVAVYPIKVNQQRTVVETIIQQGGDRVGLEAGSKPELLAVLALSERDNAIIVCNGYKDREYIRLSLIGKALGNRVFIVVEKISELQTIIEESQSLGIQPLLGVRMRLASIGKGKWQNTGGENGKFGLSAAQLLQAIDMLQQAGLVHCLTLLHVHIGSQVPNIADIQQGIRESARYFAELHGMGIGIEYFDVGGGLGIDYEGTRSRHYCSINYSVQEYANKIVHALLETCQSHRLPHPIILTESGRAMTAHHAVLISNIINVEKPSGTEPADKPNADAPSVIVDLWNALQNMGQRSVIETYHDAVLWQTEAQNMFLHGTLDLQQRAQAEYLYQTICHHLLPRLNYHRKAHRDIIDELKDKQAAKYFCNFSLFQSIPDAWAIDQVFPVLPLQRLREEPLRRAVIEDLTCDSDGRIKIYVDQEGVETTLPLHDINAGEDYLIGIFLVGAYQEILGDLHNLFGDTDSINVELDQKRGFRLSHPRRGDTVKDVLRYVNFDAQRLLESLYHQLQSSDLSPSQQQQFLKELEGGLSGYTYFET